MDLNADFAGYQQKVLDSLVSVTKTASHLSSQDLGFHRWSSDKVSKSLDQQGRHLLELTSRLLKAAAKDTNKTAPNVKNLDSVEDNWSKVVDVVDDQFEKADAALDEYTGAIKRMSPAMQESPAPLKDSTAQNKPFARFPRVFDKPQIHFNRQVNNHDTTPFKPLLTYKPHAARSLQDSIGSGTDGYDHPYALEIEQYQYPTKVYETATPIPYEPLEACAATFVDTEDAMLQMLLELKRAKEIAVDLEHHDYHSYVGIVCLMQISTRDKDWIVDTLKPWREKLQMLNEVFTDPKILKLFHGSNMDMIWLQRDLGLYVVGLFDTYYAAEALNFPARGLKYLLQRFANIEAQKQYQLSDWRLRPLPDELVEYARSDTHFLLNIYDQLRNMLVKQSTVDDNLIDFVLNGSKKEASQVYKRFVYDVDSGRGSHGWFGLFTEHSNDFNVEQFGVFRALHQWRDKIARELDESPVYLIPNRALWTLASFMPTNQTELHRFCRPVPSFVTDRFNEFKDVVFEAKRSCTADPPVFEQIKKNEEKHGVFRNRWRRPREPPKPQHDGIGATLNQLRLNGDVTDNPAQSSSVPSPPAIAEPVSQSGLWGDVSVPVSPAEVEFALAFFAMNNMLPLQNMTDATSTANQAQEITEAAAASEPIDNVASTTTAKPAQNGDDIFTLKALGHKRKALEAIDVSDELPIPDNNTSPTQPDGEEMDSQRAEKKRKKEEKRAAKRAKKAETEQLTASTVPFDYASQPSLLTTPQQTPFTNGSSSAPMNPYAKALNTSTGARQNKMGKELQGKSMTFKS